MHYIVIKTKNSYRVGAYGPFANAEEAKQFILKENQAIKAEYENSPGKVYISEEWSPFNEISFTLDIYDDFEGCRHTFQWDVEHLLSAENNE